MSGGDAALVAVEAAIRQPPLAFDPALFLDALEPFGIGWQIED